MARIIFLDSGPLGLLTRARGIPAADRCRDWLRGLAGAGGVVVAPAIADYEVRRELIRLGATATLRRLDRLFDNAIVYEPLSDRALRRAAELWALMRNAGTPTAAPEALDGDCILAAQAEVAIEPDDVLTIATTNPVHLGRFPGIDAREWATIAG